MAGYVVMAIEGVLARHADGVAPGTQIPEGVKLYNTLKRVHKIALVTELDINKVSHWLQRNDVHDQVTVMGKTPRYESLKELRGQQIAELRGMGYPIDLVVDSSPSVIAEALRLGCTGLVFASPQYARPEFRPDAPTRIRQWDDIEAEVAAQSELRRRDPVSTADLPD